MSQINDLLNRGAQIRWRLRELLSRHEYPLDDNGATKTTLLGAYVDITLEHDEAISVLIKAKLFGSAFALVRPLVETMARALWINAVATPTQIEKAGEDDKNVFPKMSQMLDDIELKYADGKLYQQFKGTSWRAMCSYTHSGVLPIGRRFTNGDVKHSYGEGEIVEVLNVTNTSVLLLIHEFLVAMGRKQEADEI